MEYHNPKKLEYLHMMLPDEIDNICIYYWSGNCTRNNSCPYHHVRFPRGSYLKNITTKADEQCTPYNSRSGRIDIMRMNERTSPKNINLIRIWKSEVSNPEKLEGNLSPVLCIRNTYKCLRDYFGTGRYIEGCNNPDCKYIHWNFCSDIKK
jgi:hypothetical protein